jgi:hypothetical protein
MEPEDKKIIHFKQNSESQTSRELIARVTICLLTNTFKFHSMDCITYPENVQYNRQHVYTATASCPSGN